MPELANRSGPDHHEHLPGLGQQLQDALDRARIVGDDRDRGLLLPKRGVTEIPSIDGREQEWRVGKELLPIFAREDRGGAGDRHDQVRARVIDEGGSDVVDHRLFRRGDKPRRAHHDLDDVHGLFGTLVQFDAEVASEAVHRQVAAVERLQEQYLTRDLLSFARRRREQQQASQHGARESPTRAVVTDEAQYGTHQGFCPVQGYTSPVEP